MTRQEAIGAIRAVWGSQDGEFCVGADERAESQRELIEAMKALGVTVAELEENDQAAEQSLVSLREKCHAKG
jgi:hypothetical protein